MLDMNKMRSLVAFVGMRDPYPENDEETGPLLSLLIEAVRTNNPFDDAWLLCTGGSFLERARDLEREAREEGVLARFIPIDFPIQDVIDYAEIWVNLQKALALVKDRSQSMPRDWYFLLDSGTPQMKTSLFLAARAGLFPATLLQGIPPRFAGGSYKVREVRLDGIPEMRLAGLQGEAAHGLSGVAKVSAETKTRSGISNENSKATDGPVASSPAFVEALRRAIAAARYDDPVLLLGETGTGKTMIARRIHEASSRNGAPFVEVNCSAVAESLAESELFGSARGAYTGAEKARSGKFRAAHGGTLFLDEVGDLSLDVQAKLLKALEDKEVTPVGADDPVGADARFVAATNRDLPAMVAAGKFRRDLYERLNVVVIKLPPLRERREDIRPLAERFLYEWNCQYSEERYLTDDALRMLESYSWPGNVRGLNNALRSAANTAQSAALGPESLPEEIRCQGKSDGCRDGLVAGRGGANLPPEGINLKAKLLQVEWEYVSAAMRSSGNSREAAARLLGMTGHAFRKALRERFSAFLDEGWEEGM